jgi:hypothetical protein
MAMEENQNTSSSSGLGIDANSKDHLTEAARWAKFLAIVGFVVCGLVVILGIFAGSIFNTMVGRMGEGDFSGMDMSGLGAMMSVFYIGFALLYFFPCLFLFRFANQMKTAFLTYEQETLNQSFQNLKKMFRFVGVLTIIVLCLYALGILMLIVGRSVAGGI